MLKFNCIWCNKEISTSTDTKPCFNLAFLNKFYIFCNDCTKELLLNYLIQIDYPDLFDNFEPNKTKVTLTVEKNTENKVTCDLCPNNEVITGTHYAKLTVGEKSINICLNLCLNTILLEALLPEDSTFSPEFLDDFPELIDTDLVRDEPKKLVEPKQELSLPEEQPQKLSNKLSTPREIKAIMDQYVIGQDKAKKILSVAVYEHYKLIESMKNKKEDDILTTKKNILLLGPTGCGKTHLTRVLANILKVPFYTALAYNYTKEGYVGLSVNEMLKDLYIISGNDLEATERGIIYIDEVDKIAKSGDSNGPDVNGASVQQALLSLVEGAKVPVQISQGKKIMIDTRNILFIAGGAFTDIIPIVEKRLGSNQKKSIGFGVGDNSQENNEKIAENPNVYELIKPQDLFKYGMLEEFIGRFPTFAPIANLTQKDLVKILTETKNSLIQSYVQTFKLDNIDLVFTEEALNEIAHQSLERKTGARGLDGIIDPIIKDLEFEVAGDSDVISCTITEDVIKGTMSPIIKRKSDES